MKTRQKNHENDDVILFCKIRFLTENTKIYVILSTVSPALKKCLSQFFKQSFLPTNNFFLLLSNHPSFFFDGSDLIRYKFNSVDRGCVWIINTFRRWEKMSWRWKHDLGLWGQCWRQATFFRSSQHNSMTAQWIHFHEISFGEFFLTNQNTWIKSEKLKKRIGTSVDTFYQWYE